MSRTLSRREALSIVGAVTVFLHGRPLEVQAMQVGGTQRAYRGLSIDFSAVSAIVLRYQDRSITLTPDELFNALDVVPTIPSSRK